MPIPSTKFRDTRTGEIVTQIPIMDIRHFVEVKVQNHKPGARRNPNSKDAVEGREARND